MTEPDELIPLIKNIYLQTRDIIKNQNNSVFGKNVLMDRLIVMDDVSGIAKNCKKFAKFVTVCRKYRYHCLYVFHIIAPETQIWRKILSQTKIFNTFLSSVSYNTVDKILQSISIPTTKRYVPACLMWLNRVITDLANTDEKHCLTNGCSDVNKNGPGRYRTKADDPGKQVCYFNKPRDDELYNIFISNRIKTGIFRNGIYFKIERVQSKHETIDAEKTLKQDGTHD